MLLLLSPCPWPFPWFCGSGRAVSLCRRGDGGASDATDKAEEDAAIVEADTEKVGCLLVLGLFLGFVGLDVRSPCVALSLNALSPFVRA